MATVRRMMREESPPDEDLADESVAPAWFAVTRATACFVGAFTLLMVLGELRVPGVDAGDWWIDFRPLPKPASRGLLALSSVLFILFSVRPTMGGGLKRLTTLCGFALLGATVWSTYRFYEQLGDGKPFPADMPMPFSLHAAGCMAVILSGLLTAHWERFNFAKDVTFGLMTHAVCIAGFPLALFFCMGKADDRHAADVLVCLVSEPLADSDLTSLAATRLKVAGDLYRDHQVQKIVLAADSGDAANRLRNAMREAAVQQGIPAVDLILVDTGHGERVSAGASTDGIAKLFKEQKLKIALVSGPFYRLPRIKLNLQRSGIDVHTMPSDEVTPLRPMREAMLREAAAMWLCYLQPVLM